MIEVLQLEFMRNAILAGILVSIACGIIGSYVVINKTVFLSGGIAHAAYGGVGLGYYLGLNPTFVALPFALFFAVIMGLVYRYSEQHEDTLIGVLWAIGMALGIIFIDLTPGYTADLMAYLFGSILAVSTASIIGMLVADILIILVSSFLYNEFLALSFDEEYASILSVPVQWLYLVQLALTSLTVVLTMRIVGLIMVIALLTMPVAISIQFTTRLYHTMILSSLLGTVFTLSGLYFSYIFDLSSGATIILVASTGFFLSIIYKRLKKFYRTNRLNARTQI